MANMRSRLEQLRELADQKNSAEGRLQINRRLQDEAENETQEIRRKGTREWLDEHYSYIIELQADENRCYDDINRVESDIRRLMDQLTPEERASYQRELQEKAEAQERERKRREAEELERERERKRREKEREELQAERRAKGLCEECGEELGLFARLFGVTRCKEHKRK